MARRDEREYSAYLSEEQRRQPGCPAREFGDELLIRDARVSLPAHYALTRAQLLFSGLSIAAAVLLLGSARRSSRDADRPLAVVGAAGPRGRDRGGRLRIRTRALGRRHVGPRRLSGDRAPPARALPRASRQSGRLPAPALHRHQRRRRPDRDSVVLAGVARDSARDGRGEAPLAVFGFAFCGIGRMTNQIHQWAHMPSPPRLIRPSAGLRRVLLEPRRARSAPRAARTTSTTASRPDGATGRSRRSTSSGVSRRRSRG